MALHHSGDSFDSYNQTPSPQHVQQQQLVQHTIPVQQTMPDSCAVTLNVGGTKYVTHLSTLIGDHRESLFAEVFRAWPTVLAKYVDAQVCSLSCIALSCHGSRIKVKTRPYTRQH